MTFRYAIYFVPEPQTLLAKLGSTLLGRDSETGEEIPQTIVPGFSRERLHGLTTDARRYGLHATIKAPFFLKSGLTEQELLYEAERFVLGRTILTLPRLEITRIGAFFALMPAKETPREQKAVAAVSTLAAEAVSFFDFFRAAPSEQETARRESHKLSARQRELLAAWGYPYVFDAYRFHMTLTDTIADPAEAGVMEEGLREYFRTAISSPVHITGICVCRQDMRTHDPAAHPTSNAFTLLHRFAMTDHAEHARHTDEV